MVGVNSRIKAVIFDIGGVLVRTSDDSSRRELAKKYGLEPAEIYKMVFDSETAARATVGEVPEEQVWSDVGEKLKLSSEELVEFQRMFWAGDHLDEELVQFIRSLRPQFKTGLLSNAWGGARAVMGNRFKFLDAFDVLVFSAEARLAKPDPQIYAYTVQQLGVRPEESIFVDDMLANVEAARAYGIHGIQFKNTTGAIDAIRALLGKPA